MYAEKSKCRSESIALVTPQVGQGTPKIKYIGQVMSNAKNAIKNTPKTIIATRCLAKKSFTPKSENCHYVGKVEFFGFFTDGKPIYNGKYTAKTAG